MQCVMLQSIFQIQISLTYYLFLIVCLLAVCSTAPHSTNVQSVGILSNILVGRVTSALQPHYPLQNKVHFLFLNKNSCSTFVLLFASRFLWYSQPQSVVEMQIAVICTVCTHSAYTLLQYHQPVTPHTSIVRPGPSKVGTRQGQSRCLLFIDQ